MTTTRKVRRGAPTGELARYLDAPYVRMIIPNAEEGGYLAEVLELPGCITDGDTLEEAYRNLQDAMAGWIEASLENGRPIPEPVGDKEYSGHFPLRMSTELHRAAALRALQQGVSLNHWIAGAIAEKIANANLVDALADRMATGALGDALADWIAPKVAERISAKAFVAFGIQLGTGETPAETTQAKIIPARTGTTIMDAGDVATLAPGLPARIHVVEEAKEVKHA